MRTWPGIDRQNEQLYAVCDLLCHPHTHTLFEPAFLEQLLTDIENLFLKNSVS